MSKKKVFIEDIANIFVGINLSREEESFPESAQYLLQDLENDLKGARVFTKKLDVIRQKDSFITKTGDILISLATKTCAIVSEANKGKIFKNSFAKIEIDKTSVDPWYFCYAINQSNLFKKSISTDIVTIVRPLSASILGKGEIILPDINNQIAIGTIYKDICRLGYLYEKKQNVLFHALNRISDIS